MTVLIVMLIILCIMHITCVILSIKRVGYYKDLVKCLRKQYNGVLLRESETKDELCASEAQKNAVYRERSILIALLSSMFPSSIEEHEHKEGEEWDPEWLNVVIVNLPTGQASWHVSTTEIAIFFDHLDPCGTKWDGHTTEQKYDRILELVAKYVDLDETPTDFINKHYREYLTSLWQSMVLNLNEESINVARQAIFIGQITRILITRQEVNEWEKKMMTMCPGHKTENEEENCQYCRASLLLTGRTSTDS